MPNDDRQFRRDQWKSNSVTLNRIKQDEQRWLLFALVSFGGLLTLLFGGLGDELARLTPGQVWGILVTTVVVVQGFTAFWVGQSLTLRKQYYTTLVRLLEAQIRLDQSLPAAWRLPLSEAESVEIEGRLFLTLLGPILVRLWALDTDSVLNSGSESNAEKPQDQRTAMIVAELWRMKATTPHDSKLWEITVVSLAGALAIYAIGFRLTLETPHGSEFWVALGVGTGLGLLWPLIWYPVLDRLKLRGVLSGDVVRLQRDLSI